MYPIEVCAAVGEVKSKLSFSETTEALRRLAATKEMRTRMLVTGVPVAPIEELLWARDALQIKLAEGKDHIQAAQELYMPDRLERHNLVTFLICEEISWPEGCNPRQSRDTKFTKALHDLHVAQPNHSLRQNFILSLTQGLLSYFYPMKVADGEVRPIPYPYPVQTVEPIPGTQDDGHPTTCGFRWLPADEHHRHVMMFACELAMATSQVPIFPFTPQAHSFDRSAYEFAFFRAG